MMPQLQHVFRIAGILAMLSVCDWGQAPVKNDTQDFTIRTTSRLVLLDVSVKDPQGGFVTSLGEDAFHVYEDGKLQAISQFANADVPVTVGVVVDESGSMGPKRRDVILAAIEFIQASNPHDEIFVINFNERARRGLPDILPFSDDIAKLRAALWEGNPEGRTALYDALEMSLHHLDMGRRDKKALVLISDGGDNVSKHNLDQVMDDVLRSLATIYTIGIFDQNDPDRNPGVLRHLAQVSGGSAYFPKQLDEVLPICKQIAKEIRTRYTIGYIPSSEGKPERRIKVVASAPGRGKLIVQTRTRYMFAPEKQQAEAR